MEKLIWHTEKRKIKELIPTEGNPRQMSEKGANDLRQSLKKFNLVEIPAINLDNRIISGHQRIDILRTEGRENEEIDVRVPNRKLSTAEHREYLLRANKNLGEWNYDLLVNFSEEELNMVGFESEELDKIFQLDAGEDDFDAEAELEKIKEPKVKLGDLYQLGKHRLICGDSTKKEDVEKLMGGVLADMVFTDPPYNVNYGISKNPRHKIPNLVSDNQTPEEWEKFNTFWLENVVANYKGGDIYVWGASGPEGMKQRLWMVEMGFHWSATICWKKQQLVLTPAKYQRMYEPCFYGWYLKSTYCGDRKQTEVWEIDRPLDSKEHPTMKPIALGIKAIKNSSKRSDIILDLFGGSGSTLISCEQTSRKCYMMEIDPKYCEVIINRWARLTGQEAKKIGGAKD